MDTIRNGQAPGASGSVITATHRLARHLLRQHDCHEAARGARAWPTADILPLDAWLRRTWEAAALGTSPLGQRRLLSDDECRLVWRRILAADGHDRLDAGVIVPLVASGWRLCQSWGISLGRIEAAADSEDGRMFAAWVGAYVRELDQRGWIDGGGLLQALGLADHAAAPDAGRTIDFAGFDPWTPALGSLADALTRSGSAVCRLAPPGRTAQRNVVAARDEQDELARAFTWAAGHAAAGGDLPVAIVIPGLERSAGQARRIGLDLLAPGWQLREPDLRPVALAVGRELADYPLVQCALNLLNLLASDVSCDVASLLLRSCYIAGAGVERAGRAQAELALRRIPVERVPVALLLDLPELQGTLAASQLRTAGGLARAVRGRRLPPSQWARHFAAWLAAAGWPGDRGLASEEYQAAEAWQRLLESFSGTDEVAGNLGLGAALGFLAQQARDRPFEPESADGAVQVLSLPEAEGQQFRALWLCGMTADQWPPPARPHPLIPLALQQAAGLPEATPSGLEAQTRRRFDRLLSSADHLVLSWPAEQEQAETLRSPMLAGMGGDDANHEGIDPHPDRNAVAASVQGEAVPADPPPPYPAGQRVRGGAAVLTMQAVCPARAFAEFRLRAAPLEPQARPLDVAARGKVVHALLEILYGMEQCAKGLGHVDTLELKALFEPAVGAVLKRFLPGDDPYLAALRSLEVQRLWSLLLTLRTLDTDRPAFRVLAEQPREVHIGPLSLHVRLDRLDQLADGGELVIDYKTGNFSPGGWKRPRLADSQLPLYAVAGRSRGVAVIQIRPPVAQLRGVGDDGLGITGIKTSAAFFNDGGIGWHGALERWQLQLENLAEEFAAGDFRVNPSDRKWAVDQFAGLTRIYEFLPSPDADEPLEGQDE